MKEARIAKWSPWLWPGVSAWKVIKSATRDVESDEKILCICSCVQGNVLEL
jgi:hypothetical protein